MGEVVGALIRQRRQALGMRQEDLAAAAELSQSGISLIESGRHQPEGETARKLAGALGITVAELLAAVIADIADDYMGVAPARRKTKE